MVLRPLRIIINYDFPQYNNVIIVASTKTTWLSTAMFLHKCTVVYNKDEEKYTILGRYLFSFNLYIIYIIIFHLVNFPYNRALNIGR